MISRLTVLILITLFSCQQSRKENVGEQAPNQIETGVKTVSGDTAQNVDCQEVFDVWVEKHQHLDSIVHAQIKKNVSAPVANRQLLKALLAKDDSALQIEQPLSAVFSGIDSLPFIVSNYSYYMVENSMVSFVPEREIISHYDSAFIEELADPMIENTRLAFPEAVNEVAEASQSFNLFTRNTVNKAKISAIGELIDPCVYYKFYYYESAGNSDQALIASPLSIQLEFGNWPDIDATLKNDPITDCYDCPNSVKERRSFARLKGLENFYFIYAGIGKDTKDFQTPLRSLVYIDEMKNIYRLWYDEIDLFGCSCF